MPLLFTNSRTSSFAAPCPCRPGRRSAPLVHQQSNPLGYSRDVRRAYAPLGAAAVYEEPEYYREQAEQADRLAASC